MYKLSVNVEVSAHPTLVVGANATLIFLRCNRTYAVQKVPRTNLYLLVLEANCQCKPQMKDILYPAANRINVPSINELPFASLTRCVHYCVFPNELENYGCSESAMLKYRRPPTAHRTSHVDTSPYRDDPFYATLYKNQKSTSKKPTTWMVSQPLPRRRQLTRTEF